jgi:peptidoglycan hydrolase-like protein with peptidoglycan-binding domain
MARTLSQGMTGQDVRALQDALNYQIRRGTPLKVDGIFGPKTLERVREFQRANQLVVDGLAGPKTQGLL